MKMMMVMMMKIMIVMMMMMMMMMVCTPFCLSVCGGMSVVESFLREKNINFTNLL